jgi:hypothetical protein
MRRQIGARIVFFIIGILLLVVAFLVAEQPKTPRNEFAASTIQNIALIVLTIVIVDVLWTLVGGDPTSVALVELRATLQHFRDSVRLLADSQTTGLARLVAASGAAGSTDDWMRRLNSAQAQVDLMGYSLHVWTRGEHFERSIIRLASAGVRIRLLIMSEQNPHLDALVNTKQIAAVTADSVRAEIQAARAAFKAIAAELAKTPHEANFALRLVTTGLVVTQLCRTDDVLTSIQYLYSAVASRSPLIEVHGAESDLFERYMKEFESLWQLGTPA